MLTLYIARHGETEWNRLARWQGHTDVELNETGRAQARALAETLRGHGIKRVGSSDLCRAKETGEIVARILGARFDFADRDLRERAFGVFEGLTRDECIAQYPEEWRRYREDPRRTPPGAELQEQLVARVARALLRAASPEPTLVVTHGGAIRAMVHHLDGGNVQPIANGAVFAVEIAGGALARIRPL